MENIQTPVDTQLAQQPIPSASIEQQEAAPSIGDPGNIIEVRSPNAPYSIAIGDKVMVVFEHVVVSCKVTHIRDRNLGEQRQPAILAAVREVAELVVNAATGTATTLER